MISDPNDEFGEPIIELNLPHYPECPSEKKAPLNQIT